MDADAVAPLPAPTRPAAPAAGSVRPAVRVAVLAGFGLVVGVGIVLRFAARSDLWLDEALTVTIARAPLDRLRPLLVRDGAPPVSYVLLHGWTAVFGASTVAVRALSGVLGVLAIPLAAWAAARWAGPGRTARPAAVVAAIVVATSPFAIRYSTEARMYELTIVLVLVGMVAVARALEHPALGRLALVSVTTAALLLTQYWSFFLLAVVVVALGVVAVGGTGAMRAASRRILLAVAAGGVLFLPWLPTFRSQLAHTGTPWDTPTTPVGGLRRALVGLSGAGPLRWPLTVLAAAVLVGALFVPPSTAPAAVRGLRVLLAVGAATLVVGVVASWMADAGFQDRYAAVAYPVVAVALACAVVVVGVAVGDRRGTMTALIGGGTVVALLAVLGLATAWHDVRAERTASTRVAAAIRPQLRADDVVAYCPDQLGPSTARLLPADTRQLAFPALGDPTLVDWTDYADRNAQASPADFARRVAGRAAGGRVFLVWSGGYRTLGTKCEAVVNELAGRLGPGTAVTVADGPNGEQVGVQRFDG